jgi:aspartyl protease family protein
MLSSGARQAAVMAFGWALAACALLVSIVFFDHVKTLARAAVGMQTSEITAPPAPAPRRRIAGTTQPLGHRAVEIKAGANGHYYTEAEVNGRRIPVLVDTGASLVALTWDDARDAGIFTRESDYTQRVSTANGVARVATVVIDQISIGDVVVRNVAAAVSEPGKLRTSLLGMSFLGRLDRFDIRNGVLVLQE